MNTNFFTMEGPEGAGLACQPGKCPFCTWCIYVSLANTNINHNLFYVANNQSRIVGLKDGSFVSQTDLGGRFLLLLLHERLIVILRIIRFRLLRCLKYKMKDKVTDRSFVFHNENKVTEFYKLQFASCPQAPQS